MKLAVYERDYPFWACGFRNAEFKTLQDLGVELTVFSKDFGQVAQEYGWEYTAWTPVHDCQPADQFAHRIKMYDMVYLLDDHNYTQFRGLAPNWKKPVAFTALVGFGLQPGMKPLKCDVGFTNVPYMMECIDAPSKRLLPAPGYGDVFTEPPPVRKRLIFAGQIQNSLHKGPHNFIELAKLMPKDWEIVIVTEPIKDIPPGPWDVRRLMSTDKYVEFLKEGGVFCQLNEHWSHDPFPNGSALEAMIQGLPIVATAYRPEVVYGGGVVDPVSFLKTHQHRLDELREQVKLYRNSRLHFLDRFAIMKEKVRMMEECIKSCKS